MSRTHPLWRPYEPPRAEDWARARVGDLAPTPVEVVAPDSAWSEQFARVRGRLVAALGDRALAVEHVGSTAVPGLSAKPMIDVDLTVADSADEPGYLPDLEAGGFVLRVREPDWEEHRMVRGTAPETNVHIWSPGATEPHRHVAFRDWLRTHQDDHAAYAALKHELAGRGFEDMADYNYSKAALIYDIYERIFLADPHHSHQPQPR